MKFPAEMLSTAVSCGLFFFTSGLLVVFYLCDGALTVSVGCSIQQPVLKNVLNN